MEPCGLGKREAEKWPERAESGAIQRGAGNVDRWEEEKNEPRHLGSYQRLGLAFLPQTAISGWKGSGVMSGCADS
jgi:hypothetical protein